MNSEKKASNVARVFKWTLIGTLMLVFVAIAIPNFVKVRTVRSFDTCMFNQMWLQKAKIEWAAANKKMGDDSPTLSELAPFLQKVKPMWINQAVDVSDLTISEITNKVMQCPGNGIHSPGTVSGRPSCSLPWKQWDEKLYSGIYSNRL